MRLQTPNDPSALALAALAATLTDERRAQRFLDLSGIETVELRERLGDPSLLAAVIAFLEAHEPDLLAVAAILEVDPSQLRQAREMLER